MTTWKTMWTCVSCGEPLLVAHATEEDGTLLFNLLCDTEGCALGVVATSFTEPFEPPDQA